MSLKIGFIGYGSFSKVRQRYIENYRTVELVGFFDPYAQNDEGLRRFENIDLLLAEVDAVVVSVPPKLAPGYVIQALAVNKPVFCEKPAATSVVDLTAIEPYMKANGAVLVYGFNHRQHPSVELMRKHITLGTLGKILWMRGRYGKEVDEHYATTWRCDPNLNGGGILIDQGIHMVDLMSYLANGFDGAQAVLSNHYLGIDGVDDNGFITLYSTESKISASIHSTITQWRYLFSLEVFCEKGSMILNGLRTNSGRYGEEILTIKPNAINEPEMGTQTISYPENVSWKKEIQSFVDVCLDGDDYPYATYSDALSTTKLIDLIYKNAVWI